MTTIKPTAGRGWAYLGAALGGCLSVAANLAHSLIPPTGAPTGWRPQPGAVSASVVWPLLVVVGLEILIKPNWAKATILGRAAVYLGLTPIVTVAGFVSYRHMHGLLVFYGEERVVTYLGPFAVDGLMVMSTAALVLIRQLQRTTPTPTTVPYPATPLGAPVPVLPVIVQPSIAPDPATARLEAVAPVPTPAQVATRINPPRTSTGQPEPVPPSGASARPASPEPSSTRATP